MGVHAVSLNYFITICTKYHISVPVLAIATVYLYVRGTGEHLIDSGVEINIFSIYFALGTIATILSSDFLLPSFLSSSAGDSHILYDPVGVHCHVIHRFHGASC